MAGVFPNIGLEAIFNSAAFIKGMDEYIRKVKAGEDETKKSGLGIQKGLANIGGAAVLGGITAVGSGLAALGGFLMSTKQPASDLAESLNAVGVVFEEGAQGILEYGKTASQTVGMSQREFNQYATTLGAFLQNVGYDSEKAGEETITLTERAADMASVFNTDVATALGAIQSGLKGEFNPLEQFGVKLNAAAVEAKAMQMGLAGTVVDTAELAAAQVKAKKAQEEYNRAVAWWGKDADKTVLALDKLSDAQEKVDKLSEGKAGELTDEMKAQAALALIYEQTTKTAGDFANTSDSVANSAKIQQARMEDLRAEVGQQLIPLWQTFNGIILDLFDNPKFQAGLSQFIAGVGEFANKVIAALPQVKAFFQGIGDFLINNKPLIVGALSAIAVAVGVWAYTTISAAIPAVIAFITASAPLIGVLLLVAGVVAALGYAWQNNFLGMRDTITAFWETTVKPALSELWAWLQVNIPAAIATLSAFWQTTLLPAIQVVWAWIQTNLLPVLQTIWTWLATNIPLAITTFITFWQGTLLPALMAVWTWIQTNLVPLFQALGELIGVVLQLAVQEMATLWSGTLAPAIESVWGWIQNSLIPAISSLWSWLAEKLKPIGEFVTKLMGYLFVNALKKLEGMIASVINYVHELAKALKSLVIPKNLTPGSPTPFEIGLRGVGDAVEEVTRALAPMQVNLSRAGGSAGGGYMPTPAASNVTNVSNTFNLGGQTVNNGMDTVQLRQFILDTVRGAM